MANPQPKKSELEPQMSLIPSTDEALSPGALGAIAQAEAEVKAAVAMAIKYPRDWDVVRERLLKECHRPIFAAGREAGKGALYSKPVGNGTISGLSIRFAEAAIAAAGHIHVMTRTLSETEDQRKLSVKVWDAQGMNSYADEITIEKTLERKVIPKGSEILRTRLNKAGELLYIVRTDGDSLLNKENAAKSKSIRNSALRLMPSWLTEECREVIEATVKAKDAQDPDAAKHQILDAFSKLGITVEHIKRFLGHDATLVSADELLQLRGLFTAIRDGETTIAAVFEELETEKGEKTKAESIRDKLRERQKPVAPATAAKTGETSRNVEPGSSGDSERTPSLATAAAAPAPPEPVATEQLKLGTAVGTLLEVRNFFGKTFATLKEGGKFRLENQDIIRSARQRLNRRVIIHYEVASGQQVAAAIENEG